MPDYYLALESNQSRLLENCTESHHSSTTQVYRLNYLNLGEAIFLKEMDSVIK